MEKEKIEHPTMEQFESHLNRIGWKMSGTRLNRYIMNHEGKKTNWKVWGDRIEFDNRDHCMCCFYLKDCFIEFLLEKEKIDSLSITAIGKDSVFVLFMNHGLSK